ncbi:MAG: DUF1549 domain-containing protein, partial [Acidobacteria bacterium]|nr:DUF1549 domain-containing protein [Acidobacteriota bacterium]
MNEDKGYDRMILEMLAGDEIAPADPKVLRATGYLARSFYRFSRNVWMHDIAEYTSAGLLGLTLKCARCHDHKYDPIAQEEYYRFRAFFEPYDVRTDRVVGKPELQELHGLFANGLPRAFDGEPKEALNVAPFLPAIFGQTYRFIRGDERNPDTEHPLTPGVPEVIGGAKLEIQPVELPLEAYYPDLRALVAEDLLAQAQQQIEKAAAALAKAQQDFAAARQRVLLNAKTASQRDGSSEAESTISFEKDIKPVLEKNCFVCHSAKAEKSGLVLESEETLFAGGSLSGPAVIARESGRSPLIAYLRGVKKPRMPMGANALPEKQISLMARWIDQLPEEEPQLA